jgi:phospholipase C
METRRQFLTKAAFLSGAASLSGGLIGSIQRALAIEPEANSTFWDAEHVVILMQENRSFDHAFGTLRGVRGFNDPRTITLPNGNPVWVQTDSAGESYAPFRLNIKDTNSTWTGCLPHGRGDQVDARNDSKYDRWLDAKRSGEIAYCQMPLTMGHYNRDDIPFYYELADAFTICDQHFCSCLTCTTPNRCYLWTGTIRAQQNAESPANLDNSDADHVTNVSWPTFVERLEDLGVSWKMYQNEINVGVGFTKEEDAWLSNFGDNPIEYFTQFNVRLTPAHREYLETAVKSLPNEIAALKLKSSSPKLSAAEAARLADLIQEKSDELKQVQAERLKWTQEAFDRLSQRDKNLLTKAFCSNSGDPFYRQLTTHTYRDGTKERHVRVPRGDLFHQFREDVNNAALPMVSWVTAPEKFSDHPGAAWYGAWYIAELLDILTQNPDVWKKTIFILTYDENDGYFDHVPPFVAPDPRRPETGKVSKGIDASLEYVTHEDEKRKAAGDSRDSPIGLGYRVPLVIASPWSRGGYVCSQVFDHTSPLQFLEKLLSKKLGKEVRETNISQWRRTVCGDLTSAFRDDAANDDPGLSFPSRDEFVEQIHRAQFKESPSSYKKLSEADIAEMRRSPNMAPHMPRQEPGLRPSCALPYELVVNGELAGDTRSFEITFEVLTDMFGLRSAGSPFVVYARHGANDVRTRDYAVIPGGQLQDAWQLESFDKQHYDLTVYGPNGFYREFRGNAHDPPLEVSVEGRRSFSSNGALSGLVEIRMVNRGKREQLRVEIVGVSYKNQTQQFTLGPGEKKLHLIGDPESFNWYDFTLGVDGHDSFARRYAGRVETGEAGFSDPVIGRANT